MIKYYKKQIKILNDDEIIKIYKSLKIDKFLDLRDYFILDLILSCGLRLSEISNLKYKDFDFFNQLITIRGKGSKQRYIVLCDWLEELLERYIKNLNDINFDDNSYLFTNFKNSKISNNDFMQIFRNISKKTGIKINPSILRNTYAVNFLVKGGDIQNLRIILGHKNFYMIRNYVDFIEKNKKYWD